MIDTGLQEKVVLITGANSPIGIGAATARAFAAQGASVFISYLRMPPPPVQSDVPGQAYYESSRTVPAEEVVASIRQGGGRAEAWEADLAEPEITPALFERVESAFGPVDVLVHNAAHWQADTFVPTEEKPSVMWPPESRTIAADSIDPHFAVNTRATALLIAEFARRHVARGATWGRIITLSTGGAYCFPNEVSYGASKAALESYSRSAARELGPYGITVNIVSPGPTQTGWIAPDFQDVIIGNTPLRRLGMPADVANVILLLASEQGGWLTGQLLNASGGHNI
jgi:3-oxoacyl-[acyl-carrier protein] reductase